MGRGRGEEKREKEEVEDNREAKNEEGEDKRIAKKEEDRREVELGRR